ncbi:hypothetical protein [Nocardia sp. CY41]|uniref:hypothetical protein n=1 Tax=Nocardia sp. CY41 TaxID=2608686 RepID=UPI00135B86B1|nr:hypothetical protein [Nocardia sp. CY41]
MTINHLSTGVARFVDCDSASREPAKQVTAEGHRMRGPLATIGSAVSIGPVVEAVDISSGLPAQERLVRTVLR